MTEPHVDMKRALVFNSPAIILEGELAAVCGSDSLLLSAPEFRKRVASLSGLPLLPHPFSVEPLSLFYKIRQEGQRILSPALRCIISFSKRAPVPEAHHHLRFILPSKDDSGSNQVLKFQASFVAYVFTSSA